MTSAPLASVSSSSRGSSPTSLVAIIPVALVGAWRQAHYGNVRLADGLWLGVLSPVGVVLGAVVANAVPERALEIAFSVLIPNERGLERAHELGAEPRLAGTAPAERQRKGIEQDGFARTGLAGEHGKSAGEFDIESFDQDDVADRQTRQHEKVTYPRPSFLKAREI